MRTPTLIAPPSLIAGNWKMNGLAASLAEAKTLADMFTDTPVGVRVALCPPATLLAQMAWALKGSDIGVGGQDCHAEALGAFTGDISAEMLKDAGARYVIVGHSERRAGHGESDAIVAAKAAAAVRAGLEPIVCVGETLEERQAGRAAEIVQGQVRGSLPKALEGHAFAVAYEPVWAIGTGLTPTLEDIAAMHRAIRADIIGAFAAAGRIVPILYGGSVKPANAREILSVTDVNGALVGGASLKGADFIEIVRAG